MLTPLDWVLATAIVTAGTVVQGSIGFGVALVGAPLLFLIDPVLVPGPMIVGGMAVPALVLWRDRAGVEPREIARLLPGAAVGAVAAGFVLGLVPADWLGVLFGVLVLLAVGLSAGRPPPVPGRGLLALAGGVAGFMATTTSIGGPPLALLFQGRSGTRLRGTLSACFVPIALLALAALWSSGHLGRREVGLGLGLLPAVVIGFWLSGYCVRYLDRQWLRGAVLAVSALAGIAAILRALV